MKIKLKDLDIKVSSGIMRNYYPSKDNDSELTHVDSLDIDITETKCKCKKNLYKLKEQYLRDYGIEMYIIINEFTYDGLGVSSDSIGVILYQNGKFIGNNIPVIDMMDGETHIFTSNNKAVNFLMAQEAKDKNTYLSFKENTIYSIIERAKIIKNKLDSKEYIIR